MAASDFNTQTDSGGVTIGDTNILGTGLNVSGTFNQQSTSVQTQGTGAGAVASMFGTPNVGIILLVLVGAFLLLRR